MCIMTGTYVITNATNNPPSFTIYQLYKLGKKYGVSKLNSLFLVAIKNYEPQLKNNEIKKF